MQRFSLAAAEQWALLAVLLFLPSIEAPKNIAAALYLVVWLLNRLRSRDWGGPWSAWDTTVLAMIGGAYASILFGAYAPVKGLSAGNDVLTYGLVFLAVRRGRYQERFLWQALGTAVIATLLTLAYGYWGVYVSGRYEVLELHSIGHVNHSALYVAIIFAVAFSWLLATWGEGRALKRRCLLGGAVLVLWISLFISEARGAILPATALVVCLPWLILPGGGGRRKVLLLLPLVMIVGALAIAPRVIEKTRANSEAGIITSYRPALARTALLAFREYPVFGVGITAFRRITPELSVEWQRQGGDWLQGDLFHSSHAHNLYANTLAERGLAGFVPLMAFFFLCAADFFRSRRWIASAGTPLDKVLWGSAFGAWFATAVGGLFNTSLHHEHALITVVLIALWLAHENSRHSNG